jgi:hypothetical protein
MNVKWTPCRLCGNYMRSPAHRCYQYNIIVGETPYNVYGEYPENAVERLSKHLNKEIYCTIGSVEFVTEEVADTFHAFVVFENDYAKKIE